jgi:predicted RNA-binding Zn ribbon-like protein
LLIEGCQVVTGVLPGGKLPMKFEFVAGNLALDFANSVHDHGSQDPQDDLKTYADLTDWCVQAGVLSARQRRELLRKTAAQAKAEFERGLELRETLYAIFSRQARSERISRGLLQRLNSHLRVHMAEPDLRSAGRKFELTWGASAGLLQRVRGELTHSAISLLTSDQLDRVRQCAGDSCTWLFLDTSRNGLRRWCDMQACGNRAKVRRFRRRSAAD